MGKFILVVAVIVAVLALMSIVKRNRMGQHKAKQPSAAPRLNAMLACAHCGTHVPDTDALAHGGQAYCSPAHRDLGPKADAKAR
jgi:uncharacterized protein